MSKFLDTGDGRSQDTGVGSSPIFSSTEVDYTQYKIIPTPSVPAAGKSRLYVKSDGLYLLNSGGVESKISGGGGTQTDYNFSTDITATDPGTGVVKFNNTVAASVTEIYISTNNQNGDSMRILLQTLDLADTIYFTNTGGSNQKLYAINATIVDNTTWFVLPVSLSDQSNAATYANAEPLDTTFFQSGHPFDQDLSTGSSVEFKTVSLPLAASAANADAGRLRLYADSTDGKIRAVDEVGTTQTLGGTQWRGVYDQTTHYKDEMSIQDD